MKVQRRTAAVTAIAAALLCLAAAGLVAWRAERTLRGLERDLAGRERLAFEVRTVSAQPNPGFEAISAPAIFKGGAAFNGRFYLDGPAGLFVFSTDGVLEHIFHVGVDLPTAPLGQMAVGTLTDSHQPELLIATDGEGVLGFDGQRFRQIRPAQDEARRIATLLPLASGRLLVGTTKLGLLVYDGETLRAFHPTTNNTYVTALAGTEAELWVGTLNDGLLHWKGGQTERIGEEQGLSDRRVESIALADGRAYVGTPIGVAELRDGKVARVLANGLYAHALAADGDSLLVGQLQAGVARVSLGGVGASARRPIVVHNEVPSQGRFAVGTAGEQSTIAQSMIEQSMIEQSTIEQSTIKQSTIEQFLSVGEGRYAVADGGLLRLDPGGEWSKVLGAGESLLTDRDISSLLVSADGRLWIGYFDRGLDIVPANGGEVVHVEDEHIFCVNRLLEDRGMVAVATANGLVLFDRDGQQRKVLGRDAGLIADHVTDIALYGGGMAVATPAGITFLDKSGAHSIYVFQGLVNNHVYALGTNGNQLVAGTLGGLSLLSSGTVRRNLTTATSGLKHNWITALVPLGDDWLVGTYGAGVLRMTVDGNVTTTDATRKGVVVNPTAMLADGRVVLAGTLGQGLLVGDGTGTRWRTVTAGLPSLNVTALAVSAGVLYVGTDNGLVKISENKL